MDLEYLERIFQEGRSALDVSTVFNSRTKLAYILTDKATGQPHYISPSREAIFREMTASCALPFVHASVSINGARFFDGGFSGPIPLQRAIEEGNEEILIVFNGPIGYFGRFKKKFDTCWPILHYGVDHARRVWKALDNLETDVNSCSLVRVIQPRDGSLIKSKFDTDRKRINQTFDMGVRDAEKFLRENQL